MTDTNPCLMVEMSNGFDSYMVAADETAIELLQEDDGLVTALRRYDDYLRRCLCACLDFGFAIIGMIALTTPDPGEDWVKRLIMELQALNDLKINAVTPYQRPE